MTFRKSGGSNFLLTKRRYSAQFNHAGQTTAWANEAAGSNVNLLLSFLESYILATES